MVATITRDLRAALVSHTPPPPPRHTGAGVRAGAAATAAAGRPPARAGGGDTSNGVQSFDYVVKQVARTHGASNYADSSGKTRAGMGTAQGSQYNVPEAAAEEDDGGCLPVSFLSSSELITVVVPYLKCLLAMYNAQRNVHHSQQQQLQYSPPPAAVLLHPGIQKHISALMGALPAEDELESDENNEKESVLIGRHHHTYSYRDSDLEGAGAGAGHSSSDGNNTSAAAGSARYRNSSNTSLNGHEWWHEDELEEFSD